MFVFHDGPGTSERLRVNARLMRGKVAAKYKKVVAGLAEMEVNFNYWKVPELKKYLQARGISVSN